MVLLAFHIYLGVKAFRIGWRWRVVWLCAAVLAFEALIVYYFDVVLNDIQRCLFLVLLVDGALAHGLVSMAFEPPADAMSPSEAPSRHVGREAAWPLHRTGDGRQ